MKREELDKLRIPSAQRRGRGLPSGAIFAMIGAVVLAAAFFAWPRKSDEQRVVGQTKPHTGHAATAGHATAAPLPSPAPGGVVLTTSGYIVNRERIELSPRFAGVVAWVGVRKGDHVEKGQVVVKLDDVEQRARLVEAEGAMARAEAALDIATSRHARLVRLRQQRVESEQQFETTEAELRAAQAGVREAQGLLELARANLDWTVIRSPVKGVVLEKLADEGELVSPQSFGGEKGPETALIAVADPEQLQVEVDLNESDLARIAPGQPCRVTPEAYPEKHFDGFVAEIAPEANRQKGTLQVKVQILDPDEHLIPELSAKVDFLEPAPKP